MSLDMIDCIVILFISKIKILFITSVINNTGIRFDPGFPVPERQTSPLTQELSSLSDSDFCAQWPCCMGPLLQKGQQPACAP